MKFSGIVFLYEIFIYDILSHLHDCTFNKVPLKSPNGPNCPSRRFKKKNFWKNQIHLVIWQILVKLQNSSFRCILNLFLGSWSFVMMLKMQHWDTFSWLIFIYLTRLFQQDRIDKLHIQPEGICIRNIGSYRNGRKSQFQLS